MTNQTTLGLERQIGPFSGPYFDIGPDRDQVPKSGPFGSTDYGRGGLRLTKISHKVPVFFKGWLPFFDISLVASKKSL